MGWKRNKYHAQPTTRQGKRFDSKMEARFYDKLCLQQSQGMIDFFLRQVPFHLPGNTKYVADFLIFYADGTVRLVDVKGVQTATFKLKKKQVEELYPVEVEVVSDV